MESENLGYAGVAYLTRIDREEMVYDVQRYLERQRIVRLGEHPRDRDESEAGG